MTDNGTDSVDGVANNMRLGDDSVAMTPVSPAVGDDSDATLTALDRGIEYTLTVPQALERFALERRKVPSGRTVQRYCDEGTLKGRKVNLTITSGTGNQVNRTEWRINEQSLNDYIKKLPIIVGDDSVAMTPRVATTTAGQPRVGDDNGAKPAPTATTTAPTVATPPSDITIENARLLATIEADKLVLASREELIRDLKDERTFLRGQIEVKDLQLRTAADQIAALHTRSSSELGFMEKLGGLLQSSIARLTGGKDLPAPEPQEGDVRA